MIYVPIVTPPTNAPPPSPRVRELAGLLTKVLSEYTKAHPETSKGEIRAALRLAQASAGPDRSNIAALLSLTLGVGVAALMVGILFFRGESGGVEWSASVPMIAVAIMILMGILIVITKIKSP